MIKQLENFEKKNLDDWYDLEENEQVDFQRRLVDYFVNNKTELRNYCSNLKPKEFSSLSIIYEAISIYSFKFNDFILKEIKRIVLLAKRKEVKTDKLEILEDFELEDIYEKDNQVYQQIIDFLIFNLSNENSDKFNMALLDIIDYYLIESDDNEQSKVWKDQLTQFSNISSQKVKKKIKENKPENSFIWLLKKKGVQLQILFYSGLILQLFAISLFRKTAIETNISVGIYIIIGLIGLLIFNSKIKEYAGNLFQRIVYSIVTFGGFTVFIFLFLNFMFASKEIVSTKYEIIEKLSLGGGMRKTPRVFIIMDNLRKEVLLPNVNKYEIEKSKYLVINKSKGLFGFDIIHSKELE